MTNKKTGFWIRFSARILDLIFVASIAIASAFLMMSHDGGWHFKNDWVYYVWTLEFVVLTGFWFIGLPLLMNGQTPFMWLFRIKIVFESKNKFTSMLKRELLFSINWILTSIFVAAIINHTLINSFAKTDQDNITYTDWEKIRIGMVTSVTTILMVVQFIYSMSIFVRGDKKGLHDTQSKTWTVWKNKLISKPKKDAETKIRPRPINNNPVVWVE